MLHPNTGIEIGKEVDELRAQLAMGTDREMALEGKLRRAEDIVYMVSIIQRHPNDSFAAARALSAFLLGKDGK